LRPGPRRFVALFNHATLRNEATARSHFCQGKRSSLRVFATRGR
jgi:hypothetical protein